jgi:hypothetical protein
LSETSTEILPPEIKIDRIYKTHASKYKNNISYKRKISEEDLLQIYDDYQHGDSLYDLSLKYVYNKEHLVYNLKKRFGEEAIIVDKEQENEAKNTRHAYNTKELSKYYNMLLDDPTNGLKRSKDMYMPITEADNISKTKCHEILICFEGGRKKIPHSLSEVARIHHISIDMVKRIIYDSVYNKPVPVQNIT